MTSNQQAMIDAYGRLDAEIKLLEREKSDLRKALIQMGEGTHVGENYQATISKQTRETLNREALDEYLPAGWFDIPGNVKVTESDLVRVTRLPDGGK